VNAGFNFAFAVWIWNAYLHRSAEIEEAAMVTARGRRGCFLRVTLPLAAPGLAHGAILTVIAAGNESCGDSTSHQATPHPLPSALLGSRADTGTGRTCSAPLVGPVQRIILFAMIERRVVGGLTAGLIR